MNMALLAQAGQFFDASTKKSALIDTGGQQSTLQYSPSYAPQTDIRSSYSYAPSSSSALTDSRVFAPSYSLVLNSAGAHVSQAQSAAAAPVLRTAASSAPIADLAGSFTPRSEIGGASAEQSAKAGSGISTMTVAVVAAIAVGGYIIAKKMGV